MLDEKPMPKSKPLGVKVPKVGRPGPRAHSLPESDKGRRPASIILASLERDAEELSSMPLPAPSGERASAVSCLLAHQGGS